MMIKYPTRKELLKMTTKQLCDLNGALTKQQEKIKAELILRGEY